MDYEQFYRYLDTRPAAEIEACTLKVVELARKHSIFVQPQRNTDQANESFFKQHRLQISQQVWFQYAVWSKFGSGSDGYMSLQRLEQAALNLCTTSEVGEFIVTVNKSIDEKVRQLETNATGPVQKYFTKERLESDKEIITAKRPLSSVSPLPTEATVSRFEDKEDEPSLKRHRTYHTPTTRTMHAPPSVFTSSHTLDAVTEVDSDSASEIVVITPPVSTFAASPGGKKRPRAESAHTFWSASKDARLAAVVAEYKEEGWAVVAEEFGEGVRPQQCQSRWFEHLQPLQQGLREDLDWTEAEHAKLMELVPKHTIEPYYSEHKKNMTLQRVDWQAIGKVLGRAPRKCSHKYQVLEKALRTNAPFAQHEDALIVRRELEWGDRGVGLWASLEKELGRPSRIIRKRWRELYEIGP